MLSIIITSIPLLLIAVIIARVIFLNKSKRRESISADISYGNVCYSCKKDIHNTEDFNYDTKDNLTLCKSCKRDETLNRLTNSFYKYREALLRYQFLSGLKLSIIMLSTMIILSILDGFINYYFDINPRLGTIANTIYLLVTWQKIEMSYRKKTI
jgi:hypothetical protein